MDGQLLVKSQASLIFNLLPALYEYEQCVRFIMKYNAITYLKTIVSYLYE
jgi:hypothetical protein